MRRESAAAADDTKIHCRPSTHTPSNTCAQGKRGHFELTPPACARTSLKGVRLGGWRGGEAGSGSEEGRESSNEHSPRLLEINAAGGWVWGLTR
jgi:hypothetical protein